MRSAVSFLWDAWRIRPTSRRILWVISVLLALSGAGMLAYPFITDVVSGREQQRLTREFQSPEFQSTFAAREILPGSVLTRIQIPRLGVDTMVVEGTEPRALRAGAGHYSHTPLPCEPGNVAIAGHRTTYGGPFNRVDELVVGDEIVLVTPERTCRYRVVDGPPGAPRPGPRAAGWITHPNDAAVVGPLPGSQLTLTTCHPKRSAAKRLIVRATLEPASP